MNNDMKCPFCQQELHKDSDGYYTCYTDNCGCWANGGNGASGSESLWLALIRTRKALEIAVDALRTVRRYTAINQFAPKSREAHIVAKKAVAEITAILENKNGNC